MQLLLCFSYRISSRAVVVNVINVLAFYDREKLIVESPVLGYRNIFVCYEEVVLLVCCHLGYG
jgi:hypothetical protein